MIILNASQAAEVRGMTEDGHALEPVLLADGATYVLPEAVLSDPAHAAKHTYLVPLPTREVLAGEYPKDPDA